MLEKESGEVIALNKKESGEVIALKFDRLYAVLHKFQFLTRFRELNLKQ